MQIHPTDFFFAFAMLDKSTLVKPETFEKEFKETALLPACAYAAEIIYSTVETVAGVEKGKGVPGQVLSDVFAQNTSMSNEKCEKLWAKAGVISFDGFRKQVIEDRSIARVFKNAFLGSTEALERKQTAKKIEMPKA